MNTKNELRLKELQRMLVSAENAGSYVVIEVYAPPYKVVGYAVVHSRAEQDDSVAMYKTKRTAQRWANVMNINHAKQIEWLRAEIAALNPEN